MVDGKGGPARRRGKTVVLRSAPAWSFGGKTTRRRTADDAGPGPGTYDTVKAVAVPSTCKRAPQHSFGSGRNIVLSEESPGPSAYDPELVSTNRTAAHHTIAEKASAGPRRSNEPGPGHYDIQRKHPVTNKGRNSPSFSIQGRWHVSQAEGSSPSAAEYDCRPGGNGPAVTMPSSRPDEHNSFGFYPTPGPSEYHPYTKSGNPSYTFRESRERTQLIGQRNRSDGVPGPGAHSPELKKKVKNGDFTRANPKPKIGDDDQPGPGTYNQIGKQTVSQNRSAPSTIFAGKPFSRPPPDAPAPDAYNPGLGWSSGNSRKPAFTFRGVEAIDLKRDNPGPGKYKLQLPNRLQMYTQYSYPAYSILARNMPPGSKDRKPGPQSYSPQLTDGKGKKVTMKFRHERKEVDPGPGPGEYRSCSADTWKLQMPSFSMRLKLARELEPPPGPGPAAYDTAASTIGNWGCGHGCCGETQLA